MDEQTQPNDLSQHELQKKTTPISAIIAQYEPLRAQNSEIAEKVESRMRYRQNRIFHLFANEKEDYFLSMWRDLQAAFNQQFPSIQHNFLEKLRERQSTIIQDILEGEIQIEFQRIKAYNYDQEQKQKKIMMLRDQSQQIQRKLIDINHGVSEMRVTSEGGSQSRLKQYEINEQKVKEYQQFMKKQKKEREERAKLHDEKKRKGEQVLQKKEQQIKQNQQRLIKEKKEEILKKLKQAEQKRQKDKRERQERQKEYRYISRSLASQPPLFKKLQTSFHNRYQISQKQRRSKAMSERHSMLESLDAKNLEQHERKYDENRLERQRQRRQRMQEFEKMMELQQQQLQTKYKSNYDMKTQYVNMKEQERKLALQKRQKIKKYIQQTVKEKYLPRIDQQKRKQFLKIIEDLDKKKLRKVKREDGSFQYQEVKPSDPRMIGLEYLQKTKQMAAQMRVKRKNSEHIPQSVAEKSKVIDYLGEMRKKPPSLTNRDRFSFVSKKDMSFEDKLKKIQLQSEKLQELAKKKQIKLKFGKFSTSEQILQHKEQIDQHYIDIINMKLKLINYKQE